MTGRFWLRPKWVAGHVLCLTLIVLFLNLGFWQLDRWQERKDLNARIERRMEAAPVPLADALADGTEGAEYRRVHQPDGRWDDDATVLVRSRTLESQPGYHVVTPLVLDDGALLVNRGWAPLGGGGEEAILEAVRTDESGPVTVEGIVRRSEERGSFGPRDPDSGVLRVVSRLDVERIGNQLDEPVAPVFLQLTGPAPEPGGLPRILPPPETDDGPHLSYAMQWFIFATVGIVGWPLLLRKTARDQGSEVVLSDLQ